MSENCKNQSQEKKGYEFFSVVSVENLKSDLGFVTRENPLESEKKKERGKKFIQFLPSNKSC